MVSIICSTYNHEKYIKDALDGFLMQKTNFEIEIVIHDDASTDNTVIILKEYEKNYPELIRVIYETENQFSKSKYPPQFFNNFMRKELNGKYIAMCEGDDYWIDCDKLQTQIDYMESNYDCVMTGHDTICLNCQTGEKKRLMLCQEDKDITVNGFIKDEEDITTASLVFRREMLYMDDFFLEVSVGDYPLKLYCLTKGKVHYFERPMSVYRYLREGSWSSNQISNIHDYLIRWTNKFTFLERYNKFTQKSYINVINEQIKKRVHLIVQQYSSVPVEEFQNLCRVCDKDSEYEAHKYYLSIVTLFRQYYDISFLDDKIYEFVSKNRFIYIWGAGKFGKLLAKQLMNHGIDFEGFIVSDNKNNPNKYLSKNVWNYNEVLYKKEEIGILVAVGLQLKEDIYNILDNLGFINYYYPFELNCEEILYV
ncbi:MAG: glycosyltransferase [Lachnospiraceae bacterium]|nr:glycosyltransferase [Lachnospiraceae bacterium]